MTQAPGVVTRQHGNPYNIFILVLTVMSLGIMFAMLLPVSEAEREALRLYDNIACLVFLGDFFYNLTGSHPKRAYFIKGKGWLDLLGSIPSFGFFQFTVLLRLFRLSRLARIARLLKGQAKKELIADIVRNRGQYALFLTLLLVFIVLTVSSLLVLQFESAGGGSIKTAGDAIWWAIVTITTVGYGDYFPVTPMGRVVGVAVMAAGIGIIGALASILANLLVSPTQGEKDEAAQAAADAVTDQDAKESEAQAMRQSLTVEVAALREEMAVARAEMRRAPAPPGRRGSRHTARSGRPGLTLTSSRPTDAREPMTAAPSLT